jgi:hypothetical protein
MVPISVDLNIMPNAMTKRDDDYWKNLELESLRILGLEDGEIHQAHSPDARFYY